MAEEEIWKEGECVMARIAKSDRCPHCQRSIIRAGLAFSRHTEACVKRQAAKNTLASNGKKRGWVCSCGKRNAKKSIDCVSCYRPAPKKRGM